MHVRELRPTSALRCAKMSMLVLHCHIEIREAMFREGRPLAGSPRGNTAGCFLPQGLLRRRIAVSSSRQISLTPAPSIRDAFNTACVFQDGQGLEACTLGGLIAIYLIGRQRRIT